MKGKTIGIIGTGKIGRAFAKVLQGFGMKILAYDLYPNADAANELAIEYVTPERIFQESDIISLHCPLTTENTHIINDETIQKMKKGVILLNTSRGKLINSKALIKGLKSGKIGAAGLDVYEEETNYFFEDQSDKIMLDDTLARLMTFSNVIVTSHQAFFTREAIQNIVETTLSSCATFAEGEELKDAICLNCNGERSCPGKKRGETCKINLKKE